MISITNDAAHICHESVRQFSLLANTKLLRLRKENDRASLALEPPRSGDEIVFHQGVPVLAVPGKVAKEVSDMTLDVSEEGLFFIT